MPENVPYYRCASRLCILNIYGIIIRNNKVTDNNEYCDIQPGKDCWTLKISDRIEHLYDKDISAAYANLREMEALSDREETLYPYCDIFLSMLKSEKYVIRVRGFRLLCRQARWDRDNKIDAAIDKILTALEDEKPTAVRQALQALEYIVIHKEGLRGKIRKAALAIDCSRYKDSMQGLIMKDISSLVRLTEK